MSRRRLRSPEKHPGRSAAVMQEVGHRPWHWPPSSRAAAKDDHHHDHHGHTTATTASQGHVLRPNHSRNVQLGSGTLPPRDGHDGVYVSVKQIKRGQDAIIYIHRPLQVSHPGGLVGNGVMRHMYRVRRRRRRR
jgi:hypothetical protein